ncbi:hypothetical protein AVEN_263796-1, partial [Araneus ventricosus]
YLGLPLEEYVSKLSVSIKYFTASSVAQDNQRRVRGLERGLPMINDMYKDKRFFLCASIHTNLLQTICGGLVVRSRLWGRRAPGSKPDSTEDPPCMGPVAR